MVRPMTISSRINKLASLVPTESTYVYDHCCDHALIGKRVKELLPDIHVIALDIVDKIINNHKDSYIPEGFEYIKQDSTSLKIKTKKQTHIIAGIGGELTIKIFNNILAQDPDAHLIISPHNKITEVRSALLGHSLRMFAEFLIHENGQYYEILSVSQKGIKPIPLYGDEFWEQNTDNSLKYLERLTKYLKFGQNEEHLNFLLTKHKDIKSLT